MKKNWLIYILLLTIIILLLLFYFKGCSHCQGPTSYTNHIPADMSQVILWKNPDSTDSAYRKYISDHFPNSTIDTVNYCKSCDSNLVMVSGADVVLYLQGKTTSSGSGGIKTQGTGGDGPALISLNFPIEIIDSGVIIIDSAVTPSQGTGTVLPGNYSKNPGRFNSAGTANSFPNPVPPPGSFVQADSVTVAVFDSGIDPVMFASYLYKSDVLSCMSQGANNGWNFFDNTPDWSDDNLPPHGTCVSRFIIDQANKYNNNFVKILPVKISSSKGVSHLFDVLCALTYAKNRGADIVNASFGFYAPKDAQGDKPRDSSVFLFKKFIEQYLNEHGHGMLMIAAAGNKDDVNENYVYASTDPVARRNLDSVSFYPASFAKDIANVIAVTTVKSAYKKVSPHQNFSPQVVDLGINADFAKVTNGDTAFLFADPLRTLPNGIPTKEGSSFATPIATGKIAANYYLIENLIKAGNLQLNTKKAVLDILYKHGILHADNAFTQKIKGGRIMDK